MFKGFVFKTALGSSRFYIRSAFYLLVLALVLKQKALASEFVHPGTLHTQADLDRMKAKVAAHESPWIEDWEKLLNDPFSQSTYRSGAKPNLGDANGGASRQRASRDAHAAYLNFIRWYISGDRANADCAIRICNDWSAAVNQIPSGHDIPGLSGISIGEFAIAGELLASACPYWEKEDQERFKNMMRQYFYPQVHDYLEFKNRTGDNHAWANWDICNIQALIAMGVLLDDRDIFNEGVEYFKNGRGTGSIENAVYYMHSPNLGQWQESGRDQSHAQLGVGMLGQACEIAWNQGLDLFSYDDNRLLAGAEYVAATALWKDLPFKFYTNSDRANNYWIAFNNGGGRLNIPIWQLIYNHYVVRRGLKAPNVTIAAKLSRPDVGGQDHFGYGTLTFTLDGAASPLPAPPAVPTGLTALPGLGRVYLSWKVNPDYDASGYVIRRAPVDGGDYEIINKESKDTTAHYSIDETAKPGVAYRYVVAAHNLSGDSADSEPVTVTPTAPDPLPSGWSANFVGEGEPSIQPEGAYSEAGNHTFTLKGPAGDIGGNADNMTFISRQVNGDCVFMARLLKFGPGQAVNKVGLMIRESLAPNARMVCVTLGDQWGRGTRARFRTQPGERARTENGDDYTWAPVWLKVQRQGDTFIASHSLDGVNWFDLGSPTTISMPSECQVGFAVCFTKDQKPFAATFDNVTLTESSTPPATVISNSNQ